MGICCRQDGNRITFRIDGEFGVASAGNGLAEFLDEAKATIEDFEKAKK